MEARDAGGRAVSRRGFLGSVAAAAAGTHALGQELSGQDSLGGQLPKPNSTIHGVRVGINAPYSFHGEVNTAEEVLAAMVQLGLSWVELRGPTIEEFAGLPPMPPAAVVEVGAGAEQRTPQQIAAQQAARREWAEEVRRWRLSQSMDRFRDLRRMYDQAGITIDITKFPELGPNLSDDEVEYVFEVSKALGAYAITCEPPLSATKRLGQFATRHRLMLGYHNHANVTSVEAFARPGSFEQAFFYSPFNGANVDIGHWIAGNNTSPIPFIREYRHRITNLHLKDRRLNNGTNTVWGEGDTPIAEVLRMMRDEKDVFQATIEMEYPIPPGSSAMAELARSVQFIRDALNAG